jgi:hypothetical protein
MLGLLVVAVARLTWLQIVVRTPPHYNCDIVVVAATMCIDEITSHQ